MFSVMSTPSYFYFYYSGYCKGLLEGNSILKADTGDDSYPGAAAGLLAQPMLIYPGVNSLASGYINWYFSYIANIFLVLMISQLWFYKVLVMASIFTPKKLTELIELIFNIILPLRNKELTHPSHWCNKDLHYMVYMKSCPNQKASSHHWNQQWLNASYKLQSWQKFSSKYIFIQKMCLKMLSAMRCQVCRVLPLC